MRSEYNKVNVMDIIYAALITVATTILGAILPLVQAGGFTWQAFLPIAFTGLMAGFAYVAKQLKSNSEGQLLKKEQ